MADESRYNFTEKIVINALAALVGIITVLIAILIASGVCFAICLPDSFSTLIAGVCIGVGSMLGGFLSARKIKSGGIINGLMCGIMISIVISIISLGIGNVGVSIVGLSHFLISVISSAIGGIFGINSSSKYKAI